MDGPHTRRQATSRAPARRDGGVRGRRGQGVVLERNRRFSESLLWRLQRSFFDRLGAQAWTRSLVPHYITSNPWIADAYAKVVLGWLRDLRPALDLGQPVHVVELGCGPGRFSYHFLIRFFDLLSRSPLAEVPVRYVTTDFTEHNLDVLRSHPALQPLVEAGLLDFARYDAGVDVEIALSHSGEVLAPPTLEGGGLANPLAVIANYVFDSLPQDCFTLRGGRLHESLATLTSPRCEPDLDDPELLSRVELSWKHRPLAGAPYGEPDLDRIVEEYCERLSETTFLLPSAALRCLANLARLAGGRLLLLSGDKGFSGEASLAGRGEPTLSRHGSVSMMVNYHAIGRWVAHRGGTFLACSHESTHLNVSAALLGTPSAEGEPPGEWAETLLAFDDAIERRGPDDFFTLKKAMEERYEFLTLDRLLAWLRLSGWDHNVFLGCFPTLMERVAEAPQAAAETVVAAAQRIWEAYFPMHEGTDLAFHLGLLAMAVERWQEALGYFEQSQRFYGDTAATAFNCALCLHQMGEREVALERLDDAMAAGPDLAAAEDLRRAIQEEGPCQTSR